MQTPQNQTILLISNEPGRLKNLSSVFQQIGYNILSASDGREGFRLTRHVLPDLVISEMNLSAVSAVELCRLIRADKALWATPLIFVSESFLESKDIIEILDAGADECLCEFFNPHYLAAKAAWLIKRNQSENQLLQNYEIIRGRQANIAQIIKGTAGLFTSSAIERKTSSQNELNNREFSKNISQKIDLGMNMISALTNLLEEQANTLENLKHARHREAFTADQKTHDEKTESNYESIVYDLIDDNSLIQ
jgi:DNA-binding response OmpR family regulator